MNNLEMAMSLDLTKYDNLELLWEVIRRTEGAEAEAKKAYFIAAEQVRKYAKTDLKLAMKYHDLAKGFVFEAAKCDFDCYMIACEWNREPNARFWLPRRSVLEGKHHIASIIQDFMDDKSGKFLALSLPPGTGKALANDTPILTRNGWKNHGDLQVGDEVIGLDGKFKKVIAVHPKCQLDRLVEFTNGEKIQCHARHEWLLYDRTTGKESLKETQEWEIRPIETGGVKHVRGHRYNLQLPHKGYVEGERKELPLDPYTLGVWLGDGANKNPRIANPVRDEAIIHRIVANGIPIRRSTVHKTTGVWYYDFDIRKQLQSMGMCHSRKRLPKHIPEEYLTASIDQRLDLLAGLIDTDGTKCGKKYIYTTCDETLRDGFIELVSTFGWRACVSKELPKISSSGIVGRRPIYKISFTPDMDIPCEVERKRMTEYSKQRKIAVKSITKVPPKEGNCITVEGDGMYLAGRTMLPTHNTTLIKFLLAYITGTDPMSANMYVSYSDGMVKMIYDSEVGIITDTSEYCHQEIFKNGAPKLSAEYNTISYRRKGDFPTLGIISLGGSVTGRTRANKYLITDDLVKNAEEARNASRLDKLWEDYSSTLTTRMIGDRVKQIMLGTIWSLYDPISRMKTEHEGENGYTFIAIPVWDENEHSNFEYDHPDNYTSQKIREIKASLDPVTFDCLYMQSPREREGILFPENELLIYNGVLPEGDPDMKVFVCDVAFGGEDRLAMPILYIYGDRMYLEDVVFNGGDKDVTLPLVVAKIMEHGLQAGQFEGNNGGDWYAMAVDDRTKGVSITSKKAPNTVGKTGRIMQYAPDIRKVYFRDKKHRTKEYQQFIDEMCRFSIASKKQHDDAPDSMAQLMAYLQTVSIVRTVIFKRPI